MGGAQDGSIESHARTEDIGVAHDVADGKRQEPELLSAVETLERYYREKRDPQFIAQRLEDLAAAGADAIVLFMVMMARLHQTLDHVGGEGRAREIMQSWADYCDGKKPTPWAPDNRVLQ
jgi:hypothetical protein